MPDAQGRYPTADVSWASAGICDGCGAKAKVRRYRRVDLGIDKVLCATCAAPPDDASDQTLADEVAAGLHDRPHP